MSVLVVPTESGESVKPYEFDLTMNGVSFTLFLSFNDRADRWFGELYDVDATLIVGGFPVTNDWPLLGQHIARSGVPAGTLLALPSSEPNREALMSELGTRVQLVYDEATA